MDAQSGLGAARPRRAQGIRIERLFSGLARAAAADRGLPGRTREGKLRACAFGRAGRGETRPDPHGFSGLSDTEATQKSGGRWRIRHLDGEKHDGDRHALTGRIPDLTRLSAAAADYDIVRRAIGHIREHWRSQPESTAIAEAAGVTPTELHHLFRRWAGLTPKAFLQAITLDSARTLLRASASVLDAAYEVGPLGAWPAA